MELLKILKFYFKSVSIHSYVTKYDFGILDTQMNLIEMNLSQGSLILFSESN